MYNPSFKSDIFYSVQNEDYQTELAVLRRIHRQRPLRVLLVASAGENALSLLTQDIVASVDAVDINPAQLHLCELRRTALEHLTRDEQLRLLGADPSTSRTEGEAERLALYEQLRPHLPDPARAFWDARRNQEIAFGLHHVGRNDIGMHDIQAGLRAAGFESLLHSPQDEDLPAWRAVYTDLMTPAYIHELFGLPSEALAIKIAGIAGQLGAYHFQALQQPHPEHNPFLTTVFANTYATAAGDDGLPLYLQLQGQVALRRLGTQERLRLHPGNIVEQMPSLTAAHGPFDLISISNIADWMTEAQFGALVVQARQCLNPGGALLARTATGSAMIVEVIGRHMQTDHAFNVELPQVERGPWFRTLAAGFRV
jgi:S-adenosylmethionine-diacylglycerol 3-amino-3-carboxypropyl transferase